jgi:hypothetical protein
MARRSIREDGEVEKRHTTRLPLCSARYGGGGPDIVKDVRGSESNCEQDSRKM